MEDTAVTWPVAASHELLREWLLTVRTDTVRMPDEHYAERTVLTHPGAVTVLALDDAERVLMIRQYRHPVGHELWELPAGLRDADGESPVRTAQRELLEETGYRAREWHTLADYFSSPGFSTERIHIFLARGLEHVADNGYQRRDEEKFIVADWVPLDEAVRLVVAGKLHNGPAITGILAGYAACAGGFSGLRPATVPET
ncbi:MAG TPA: NUDIX hydrolase [Trebonia sp.]|nr:NUDIX hydrolase [Trebonia sp.]